MYLCCSGCYTYTISHVWFSLSGFLFIATDVVLSDKTTLASLLGSMLEKGLPMGTERITLEIYSGKDPVTGGLKLETPVDSTLKVFTGTDKSQSPYSHVTAVVY